MKSEDIFLSGAGGGGGGGSFRNVPDNLRSDDTFEIVLGLGTSEMKLAPGGLQNLFVDGVPIEDGQNNATFKDFVAELFPGDPTVLSPVVLRLGQSSGSTSVNLNLSNSYTDGSPGDWKNATVPQTGANFIDLRFVVQQLYSQTKSGISNATARIEIQMRPSGATTWTNPLQDLSAPTWNADGLSYTQRLAYVLRDAYDDINTNQWYDPNPGYLTITGKTTSSYVKELRVAVPNTGNYLNKSWQIRCRLVDRDYVVSGTNGENEERRTILWESAAAAQTRPLGGTEAWRGLSYLTLYGKATDQISGIPTITGIFDIGKYMVPPSSVWNPVTRAYTGAAWDGSTTVKAWTQCPAWQIKGLIEDSLSGVSALAPGSTLNKWDTLEASKWFAQLVPDGQGGTHPRYSANWFLEDAMPVAEFVNYLAGAVGGFCWDEGDGQWRLKVEKPESPSIIFTKENIVGEFYYSHTDVDQRFNDITGVFRNAEKNYAEDRVRVFDQGDIDLRGRVHTSVALVGCDNRQEALRRTMIRMLTALNETRIVTFSTNRQGKTLEPFSTIAVADADLNANTSLRSTGRIVSIDGTRTNISLRDTVRLEVGVSYQIRLTIPNPDYNAAPITDPSGTNWRTPTITITRNVTNTNVQRGDVRDLVLDSALPATLPEYAVISLEATSLPAIPKPYRVLSIKPSDGQNPELVEISAIEIYTPKWSQSDAVTESSLANQVNERVVPTPIAPAAGVFSVRSFASNFTTRTVLSATWTRPDTLFLDGYRIETQFNGGVWVSQGIIRDNTFEIAYPDAGVYRIRIYARDRRGNESVPLEAAYTVANDEPIPPSTFLTNEAAVVSADAAGNVASWTPANGVFQLNTAVGPVTTGVTYSVVSTTGGLSVSINPTTGAYTVSGMSSDAGTALLRATWNGINYDRTLSVAKARPGTPGTPGSPGSPGTPAISGYLTNEGVQLGAYADGNIASYAPATGQFMVYSGNTSVGSNFTLSTVSNPQGLTVSYTGQTYTVTGGFDPGETTATLTIRATGSGPYAGVTLDKVFTLSKTQSGDEIVSALPSTNLFEGRQVFLTTDGMIYKYRGGQWVNTTDASQIVGLVKSSQIDAGYGQNLITNPRGQDGSAGWTVVETTGSGSHAFGGGAGWYSAGRYGFWLQSKSSSSYGVAVGNRAFSVIPGRTYTIRLRAGSSTTSSVGFYVGMAWMANIPSGGYVTSANRISIDQLIANQPMPGNQEKEYTLSWTAPSGAYWASFCIQNWSGYGGDLYFTDVEVVEQVVASKLPMGVGANLLTGAVPGTNPQRYLVPAWNPDNGSFRNFTSNLDINNSGSGLVREIIADPNSNWPAWLSTWRMPDNSNFAILQTGNGTPSSNVTDFIFDRVLDPQGNTETRIPVETGKNYEFSVYLGPHRCSVWVFILWYDAALQQIGPTAIVNTGPAYLNQNTQGSLGGSVLDNYVRLVARGIAPTGARYAACVIRKGATASGSDSYLFGTRPMFAETTSNATQALPYSPPPPGLFHAESLISNTVDTRHLRANSVKTQTLDAYAVTATKMALTNTNDIFPDPQFRDLTWWSLAGVSSFSVFDGDGTPNQPIRYARCGPGQYVDQLSASIPMEAGAWFHTKLRIFISSDAAGTLFLGQHWPNQVWYSGGVPINSSDAGGPLINLATTSIPKGSWQTYTGVDQFHPGTGWAGSVNFLQQRVRYNLSAGYVLFAWEICRANDAELIVDGAITANKISTPNLSAIKADLGDITAGTIRNTANTYRMDVTNGRTIAQTGSFMKVTGAPFGSANQFIEWYGPYSSNLATCTESNAIYYLKTNGSAYFGGTLSAGVIRNATQTTVVSPTANTELGPFGSNGGTRTIIASLNYDVTYQISSAVSISGANTATVVVERWTGSSWTQIGSFTANGSVITATGGNGPSEPGQIRTSMGGSVTVSDNSGGTSGIRIRTRIASWSDYSIGSSVLNITQSQTLALISSEG